MKVKEESENVGLKLNIQKTKIMASGPITSWQIDAENGGNSGGLYFWGLPCQQQTSSFVFKKLALTFFSELFMHIIQRDK